MEHIKLESLSETRHKSAEILYRKALSACIETLGENHLDTAGCYENLASHLGKQAEYAEAEPLFVKALDIRRRLLGEKNVETAKSFHRLAKNLASQKKTDTKSFEKVVEIYQYLAEQDYSDYAKSLASSLNNLSVQYGEAGEREAGLAAVKRAVEIYEDLAGGNFEAYGSDLASSLNNLSVRLGEAGEFEECLATIRRAVEMRENLADRNFEAYGSDLASSLNNLSVRLAEVGEREAGLAAVKRAVEIYEDLAGGNFEAYGADLASSLNNLSVRLAEAGEQEAGLAAVRQAVEIGNAGAMVNLGVCYENGTGVEVSPDNAIGLYRQAVEKGNATASRYLHSLLSILDFFDDNSKKADTSYCQRKDQQVGVITDTPLIAGNWNLLTSKDIDSKRNFLDAAFEVFELKEKVSKYQLQAARQLSLSFYPGYSLWDIEYYQSDTDDSFIVSTLVDQNKLMLLDGMSRTVHHLNQQLLVLDDEQSALDYLLFFCVFSRAEGGPFQIITDIDDIPFGNHKDGDSFEKTLNDFVVPKCIEGDIKKDGWLRFNANVLYGDCFFEVVFKVLSSGGVEMEDDKLLVDELPILQRRYDGVLRTSLT